MLRWILGVSAMDRIKIGVMKNGVDVFEMTDKTRGK